jgi:integrase
MPFQAFPHCYLDFATPICYPEWMIRLARFTDKSVAALASKAARYEVWEDHGFGIRVSPSGTKTWVWVYHFDGRPRRMTFGTYPPMGLADAHLRLAEARKSLQQGTDPGAHVVEARKAERIAETVGELAELYLEGWARRKKRSAAEDERILRKDVIPVWKDRKAKDITRKDVRALLRGIVERGAPIAANRTLAVTRKMFNWAIGEDIIPGDNPCKAVKAPGEETQRDRVLKQDEIATLWRGLGNPEIPISLPIRLALKFQLVTAQRKGEVINAEWAEFDLTEIVWTIPASKSKNALAHRVPLSPLALAVLDEIRVMSRNSTWLFSSPRLNGRPITGAAVDHAMRGNRDALGTGDATPHDLRRTAASHMTSTGISRLVVSKILNHAETGVTSVYDRHSYDREKRAALDAWARRVEEIISGCRNTPNVIPFSA